MTREERFWNKVSTIGKGNCWNWLANKNDCGYGLFAWKSSRPQQWISAHRAVWLLTKGKVPNNLFVLHTCDNRACVNPEHLRLGTQKENMTECSSKNRLHMQISPKYVRRGTELPHAKLTEDKVIQLRQLYCSGVTAYELARNFGISKSNAWAVATYKLWKHV